MTIQLNAVNQDFHVVLFIMFYKFGLVFLLLVDDILGFGIQIAAIESTNAVYSGLTVNS